MKRAAVAVLVFCLGVPATFAVDSPAFGGGKAKGKAKQAPPPKPVDPKEAVGKAKRALRVAVRLCDVPGRCEEGTRTASTEYIAILKNAERDFMRACEQCSTSERCDEERQRVRDGKRTPDERPCDDASNPNAASAKPEKGSRRK